MSKQHKPLEGTMPLYIKCCYHMEKSHLGSLYHKKFQNFIPSLKLTLCDLAVVCKLLYINNGIENTPPLSKHLLPTSKFLACISNFPLYKYPLLVVTLGLALSSGVFVNMYTQNHYSLVNCHHHGFHWS